ncbi:hypothetical protein [Nocardia altamirensis]|uniref:hypothetical protein n=1 Tax=Nocardia altamirensis TaxID=472158 RepID=UPI00083FF631|nr:hypothetical protein [Nocardia altamirensis]
MPTHQRSTSTATADGRAVLITAAHSWTPSGTPLTGPVDSIDKLETLICWCWDNQRLIPELPAVAGRPDPGPPQIWVLGEQACAMLGWVVQRPEGLAELPDSQQRNVIRGALIKVVASSLAPLLERGWTVGSAGHRIRLARTGTTIEVDLIAEIFACTATADAKLGVLGDETADPATGLDTDDALAVAELGRRMTRWYAEVDAPPATTGADTGAAVLDRLLRARTKGLIVTDPVLAPVEVEHLETRIQPLITRTPTVEDIDGPDAEYLIELDQYAGKLASAGMLTFPAGDATLLTATQARELASERKRPAALWLVNLPATVGLSLAAQLPPPDPRMQRDQPTRAWITTSGLNGLCAKVRDGGAGLDIETLDLAAAVSWSAQGRTLAAWTDVLRDALHAFTIAADRPLAELAYAAAEDYLTALDDPSRWQAQGTSHHIQQVWAAFIAEETRFRGRRAAMIIADRFRLWPLRIDDTTMTYAVGDGQDLSDPPGPLGKLILRRQVQLTDETIIALFEAAVENTSISAVLERAFAVDQPPPRRLRQFLAPNSHSPTDADADRHILNSSAGQTSGEADSAALAEEPGVDIAETPPESTPESGPSEPAPAAVAEEPTTEGASRPPQTPRAPTSPSRGARATAEFTGVAAVADVSGVWLADGSRRELPSEITNVGELVALAYGLNLGFRLSPTKFESGQIWITTALAQRWGIDTTSVSTSGREHELRGLTRGHPWVTEAVDAGWQLGGQNKNGDAPELGSWNRVWREDRPGGHDKDRDTIWVVFLAGMTPEPDARDPDMPILAGNPTPAEIAYRLDLFARTLGYPWKISGPSTGLDWMLEARMPKKYRINEWRDIVMAPSGFELLPGIGDIAKEIEWSRELTAAERARTYLHAYDRGGSHCAALAKLQLPIGAPEHVRGGGGWQFDKDTPAFLLTEIPEPTSWLYPYVLNPSGQTHTGPVWVPTPQFERALIIGRKISPTFDLKIHEAIVWHQHDTVLSRWVAPFSRGSKDLDTDDPHDHAVRNQLKVARNRGFGMQASNKLKNDDGTGKIGYWPERRYFGVSQATANIVHTIVKVGETTGEWPVAVTKDTIIYTSDNPDPVTAWPLFAHDEAAVAANPAVRPTLGRGFGQMKPEASGLLAPQLDGYFGKGMYRGKHLLTKYNDWIAQTGGEN